MANKGVHVVANAEAAARMRPLGFNNITVLAPGQATSVPGQAGGRLRITATAGERGSTASGAGRRKTGRRAARRGLAQMPARCETRAYSAACRRIRAVMRAALPRPQARWWARPGVRGSWVW